MADISGTFASELLIGTVDADWITGRGGADEIHGEDGDDLLDGGAGPDVLYGGAGNDELRPGTQDGLGPPDILYGESGNDLFVIKGADRVVAVGGEGDDEFIVYFSDSKLNGGDGSDDYWHYVDTLFLDRIRIHDTGSGADDVDTLHIRDSLDSIYRYGPPAFSGNSYLWSGLERIESDVPMTLELVSTPHKWTWDFRFTELTNIPQIHLGYGNVIGGRIFGSKAGELIGGTSRADEIHGYLGNDVLRGWNGDDRLFGDAGRDRLLGDRGNDILTGGSAADTFVFNLAPGPGDMDVITDFTPGQDRIQLNRKGFTELPPVKGSAVFEASADGSASGPDSLLLYNTTTGALFYDADGDGPTQAIQFAQLEGVPALGVDDFLFVG